MLKAIQSRCILSVFSTHCDTKTTWIKSIGNIQNLLDLVRLDESNKNSLQAQEKISKLWNEVKGNPSGYQELIVKLEREYLQKRQETLLFGKALSRNQKILQKTKAMVR